ncbi:type IV secretion system protein [Duganella sp. HH105]|uniref:type IV secretion system protein n=1 Tax=Duganella sp. HH105 TaxID=1781067 RepID=UPI000877C43E|nr:type IV secretion system protein [Duganella sp. HH105]OEZ54869.1 type IV secretion system protein virB5 precursor [Duganella sp. HH105]
MKRIIQIAVLSITTLLAAPLHAGILVLDTANLIQAMEQVAAWKKQYGQMVEQQEQLRQHYAAITGNRGMGSVASNPLLQAVVPADILKTYNDLQNLGANGLTPQARMQRDLVKIYDCEERRGADKVNCQRLLNNNAQLQALTQSAMSLVNQRTAQIQALQDQINTTGDAKAIAELQARLQAETTQVGNDANRLMLMRTMADAADRAAEQAIREKTMKSLSLSSDGSDTFTFVPPRRKP